ncbi:sugar-transfer associated ATP-grasp domain-containing protein [Pelagibius sp.]|uniref:sugar-transfer associated ATP-grasp domain-containing protein n=1 Tax=Pelagibius sp. TaxID=1931238 RepID=UPI0026153451|nr:sugar-transfer associated ATP-grasp domain-containing protein [Pelagibius sp.]
MREALGPSGHLRLLSELRDLETQAAASPAPCRSGADQPVKSPLAQHSEKIFAQARQHIRSCFPSFWGPIASNDQKIRRKFGTFFRELNLYHFDGPQIGKIVYDDKLIFDAVITKIGYGSPKAVWKVDGTRALRISDNAQMPLSDAIGEIAAGTYFAKYRIGGGGRGAFLIRGNQVTFADGTLSDSDPVTLAEIFRSSTQDYLLQEVAGQVDALSALNASSLNTIRCLTYLDRRGSAHVMGATLRLGAETMVVDNASSGGLFCGVDINRGCLFGTAVNKAEATFTRHPTSGIPFEDYPLPGLESVFQMCTRCHESIGHPMTVGWDAVISPGGPMLLEGNTRWMAKLHTQVDPGVAARVWAAYLDEWGELDIGFARAGFARTARVRDKRLTVSLKVEGKVQKVGYRRWVARHAKERALAGHVRNLDDGSVAVRLSGPARRVEAMLLLVATGPRRAEVSTVSVEDLALTAEDDFAVLT